MTKTLNKIIIGLLALYVTATLIDFNIDARQAKIRLLKNPIARYLYQEREKVKEKSKAVTLSYFVPNFERLIKAIEHNEVIDPSTAAACIKFYEMSFKYYPHLINTHALLGFSYFYAGDTAKSLDHYQKAAELNPYFFWNHYNLAILYYKQEQYEKSLASSQEALSKKPEVALKIINISPAYRYLWRRMENIENTLLQNYRSAYSDVFALIAMNQFKLERYTQTIKTSLYTLKQDPPDKDLFYYYSGLAALKLKQPNEAVVFFKKCIDFNTEHKNCTIQLALILKKVGNEEAALTLLQKASSLNKNTSQKAKEDRINPRIF